MNLKTVGSESGGNLHYGWQVQCRSLFHLYRVLAGREGGGGMRMQRVPSHCCLPGSGSALGVQRLHGTRPDEASCVTDPGDPRQQRPTHSQLHCNQPVAERYRPDLNPRPAHRLPQALRQPPRFRQQALFNRDMRSMGEWQVYQLY